MPDDAVSRRTFLDRLLFTSVAAAGVVALAPIPFFLKPPPALKPPRVRVGDFAQVFRRTPSVTFSYGAGKASAILSGEILTVIDHRCTHQGCQVALNPSPLQFECPCHGAIFAADGSPVRGPHGGPLASIPHRITPGGELEVGE